MSTVGLTALTTASRSRGEPFAEPHLRGQRGRPGEIALVHVADLLVVHDEAMAVEAGDGACQGLALQARAAKSVAHEARDADSGGARAEDDRPAAP